MDGRSPCPHLHLLHGVVLPSILSLCFGSWFGGLWTPHLLSEKWASPCPLLGGRWASPSSPGMRSFWIPGALQKGSLREHAHCPPQCHPLLTPQLGTVLQVPHKRKTSHAPATPSSDWAALLVLQAQGLLSCRQEAHLSSRLLVTR